MAAMLFFPGHDGRRRCGRRVDLLPHVLGGGVDQRGLLRYFLLLIEIEHDVFPPAQQTQIRASVAESLRGVVCQRLLPCPDGGLTLACEILVSNTAIQNLIREGKSTGLRNTMETGVKEGMCLMDNVVFGLWQEKKISAAVAQMNINNRVLKAKIS